MMTMMAFSGVIGSRSRQATISFFLSLLWPSFSLHFSAHFLPSISMKISNECRSHELPIQPEIELYQQVCQDMEVCSDLYLFVREPVVKDQESWNEDEDLW